MNFSTWIEQNKDKINWQPIETLPWELNDAEYNPPRKYMPQGIILRWTKENDGVQQYELIGDNIAGERTEGCSCCSMEWYYAITFRNELYHQYNAWAWAFGDTNKDLLDKIEKLENQNDDYIRQLADLGEEMPDDF